MSTFLILCLFVISVLTEDTPTVPKCRSHEYLETRIGKVTCENTCEDPTLSTRCTALNSAPTCRCKEGFVRNRENKCVSPWKCVKCGINEMIIKNNGRGPCENTCRKPNLGQACTAYYKVGQCVCKSGFVRFAPGICILESDCPKPTKPTATPNITTIPPTTVQSCGLNEYLESRSGRITCENTCDDPTLSTRCMAFIGNPTCRCIDGFLRKSTGLCVAQANC